MARTFQGRVILGHNGGEINVVALGEILPIRKRSGPLAGA